MENLILRGDIMNVTHDNLKQQTKNHRGHKSKGQNPVTVDIKDDMSQPVRGLPKARG